MHGNLLTVPTESINLKRSHLSPSSHEMTSLFLAKASSTHPTVLSQGADGPYVLLKLHPFPPYFPLASKHCKDDSVRTAFPRLHVSLPLSAPPTSFTAELLQRAIFMPCLHFLTSHRVPKALHSGFILKHPKRALAKAPGDPTWLNPVGTDVLISLPSL